MKLMSLWNRIRHAWQRGSDIDEEIRSHLMMDMSDRLFVNLAGGYQVGFQSRTDSAGMTTDTRARYVRTVLGVGYRF